MVRVPTACLAVVKTACFAVGDGSNNNAEERTNGKDGNVDQRGSTEGPDTDNAT